MEENNTTALVRYIKAMDFGEKNLAVSADKRERGVPLNPDDLRILDIESKQ